jgi:hypothetical protein
MSFDMESIPREFEIEHFNEVLFGFQVVGNNENSSVEISVLLDVGYHAPIKHYKGLMEERSKLDRPQASVEVKYSELLANYDGIKDFDESLIRRVYRELNDKLLEHHDRGLMPLMQTYISKGLRELLPKYDS